MGVFFMPIDFSCSCGKKLRVKDEHAGRKFKCPDCGALIRAERPAPPIGFSEDLLTDSILSQGIAPPLQSGVGQQTAPKKSQTADAGLSARAWRIFMLVGSPFSFTALGALLGGKGSQEKQGKRLPRWARLFLGIVGMLLLIGSPVVLFATYRNYSSANASEKWPSVDGVITQSSLETMGFGRKQTFKAKIEYQYQVNGRGYRASRVKFVDTTGSSESAAQSVASKYPVNSAQKVYYNPDDPSNSVLEPGASAGSVVMLAMGPLAVIGFGTFFVFVARKG
jgi:hypothetical protein